ncbi:MAG: hypothetical protein GY846_03765, partial [Deltaproteobacteria bacterium]|nr:hypothetical protein [Deltaproteobacteria bacterium]
DQVTPKEKKELRFEWTADSPGKHHVGFMCHLSFPHKDTILEDNRKTLEFEVLPAQKKWGNILGFTDSAETSGMTASAIPVNPSRINGILYGKVGGKNVPQLANGCENVSVTFFNPDGNSMGSVSAFEGDGANCRYEYHTTGDVAGLRPGAWIKGRMTDWVYHEDPSNVTGSSNRTINGELKTVSPAITAQTLTPMIPGQCRGNRQEGRFSGKVDGKGPDQWFGCENIRVQWKDYNGNGLGTNQMVPDGSGQDCRYCFEFPHPNYLSFRLPFLIGDYDMEWDYKGRTEKVENGTKVVTHNTKLLAVRDLTGPQKPDLELRFMKIAEPGNLQSNIETKLEALDAADFIYQVTNRGVSR